MEALAALSLAAAVVQFVDFGSRLVSKGQQLYRSGTLVENMEIEEATKRLRVLVEPLQALQGEDAIVVICKTCKHVLILVTYLFGQSYCLPSKSD